MTARTENWERVDAFLRDRGYHLDDCESDRYQIVLRVGADEALPPDLGAYEIDPETLTVIRRTSVETPPESCVLAHCGTIEEVWEAIMRDHQKRTDPPPPEDYRVTWEIAIAANSPGEAARQALKIMRNPESPATAFVVHDSEGNEVSIYLG